MGGGNRHTTDAQVITIKRPNGLLKIGKLSALSVENQFRLGALDPTYIRRENCKKTEQNVKSYQQKQFASGLQIKSNNIRGYYCLDRIASTAAFVSP